MYLMRSETGLPYSWMDVTGSFSIFGKKGIAFSIWSPPSLLGGGCLFKLFSLNVCLFFYFNLVVWMGQTDLRFMGLVTHDTRENSCMTLCAPQDKHNTCVPIWRLTIWQFQRLKEDLDRALLLTSQTYLKRRKEYNSL